MFVELWQNLFNTSIYVWLCIIFLTTLLYKLLWKEKLCGETKHAFITGCDSGFGYLTAYQLNALNVKVFAGCFTDEAITKFQDDPIFKGVAMKLDITKMEDIESCYEVIKNHVGKEEGMNVVQ